MEPPSEFQIKQFVEEYHAKEKALEDYFESEDFNNAIAIIRQHELISQDDLRYGTKEIDGLPEEKFRKVMEAVMHNLEAVSEGGEFPAYHADYKGIRFHLMIGQGSDYWTTKLE